MIRAIDDRRSIRKYKSNEISREIIDDMIYRAALAPSAKNRQPWKFLVYQGREKRQAGRCDAPRQQFREPR